jgi:hypothetical protein
LNCRAETTTWCSDTRKIIDIRKQLAVQIPAGEQRKTSKKRGLDL